MGLGRLRQKAIPKGFTYIILFSFSLIRQQPDTGNTFFFHYSV